jgi:hypothetical protein
MNRRVIHNDQDHFDWYLNPPEWIDDLPPVEESELVTSSEDYAIGAIRTREQCATILSSVEHRTVTVSMVRTLEDKAIDKMIKSLRTSYIANLILTAKPESVEFNVIREVLSDIARDPN